MKKPRMGRLLKIPGRQELAKRKGHRLCEVDLQTLVVHKSLV